MVFQSYSIIKALPQVLYEKYSTREHVKRQVQHEAELSAFVLRHFLSAVIFHTGQAKDSA